MKYKVEDYSKLLDGRLPGSNLEFELADKLIDLQRISNTPTLSTVPSGEDVEKFSMPIKHTLSEMQKDHINKILAQREEILTAFVAKYGFEPDEAEQVEITNDSRTQTKWFVRKRGIAG